MLYRWRRGFAMVLLGVLGWAFPASAAAAVWREGEAFDHFTGRAKRPTAAKASASGGTALYGEAMRTAGNEAAYVLTVPESIPEAHLWIRYARGMKTPASVRLTLEAGAATVTRPLRLEPTSGWGGSPSQWAWAAAPVGGVPAGRCVVRLRAEEDGADVNVDGFYLAGGDAGETLKVMGTLRVVSALDEGWLGVEPIAARPGAVRLRAGGLDGRAPEATARWGRVGEPLSPPRRLEPGDGAAASLAVELPGDGAWVVEVDVKSWGRIMKSHVFVVGGERVFMNEKTGEAVEALGDVLATLRAGHPRLILTDERLAELKARHGEDPVLQKIVADILASADAMVDEPPVAYKLIGPRLLSVSRRMLSRMYTLGAAYRWTGDRKYLDAAVANLDAACAFADWHPPHFLDTAEMTHAVAVGYDWLYPALDEDRRERIRAALIDKGLQAGMDCHKGAPHGWWTTVDHNWNQVCNGGLSVGALAVADTDAGIARAILSLAIVKLPIALTQYAPDGAWGEGPGYWGYATRYTVHALAAMETALGTDFGLSQTAGLDRAGEFPLFCAGPTGLYFNYADSHDFTRRKPLPSLLWLGRRYGRPWFSRSEMRLIETSKASPRHLAWYAADVDGATAEPPLDKYFRGRVEVAVMRSAWDDPDALWVAVKAGDNQINHGQLDLGGFELDALGVRWARDLGSDNYNMPGYFQKEPGGQRWSYYRNRSISHSVPLLDGADQAFTATAKVTAFRTKPDGARAVIDLTEAYAPAAAGVRRGVAMVAGRKAVLVQDEFDLAETAEVAWAMTTDAAVELGGDRAELTLEGRRLSARILCPAGAVFSVESAEQKPPEKANAGVCRLLARLPGQSGSCRVAVLLAPAAAIDEAAAAVEIEPLARW